MLLWGRAGLECLPGREQLIKNILNTNHSGLLYSNSRKTTFLKLGLVGEGKNLLRMLGILNISIIIEASVGVVLALLKITYKCFSNNWWKHFSSAKFSSFFPSTSPTDRDSENLQVISNTFQKFICSERKLIRMCHFSFNEIQEIPSVPYQPLACCEKKFGCCNWSPGWPEFDIIGSEK